MDSAHTLLGEHKGEVHGLVWSSDGSRLFSACYNGEIRAWDDDQFVILQPSRYQNRRAGGLDALDCSPFRGYLVTAETTGLKLFDSATGTLIAEAPDIRARDLACSPTDPTVALREIGWEDKKVHYHLRGRSLERLAEPILDDGNVFADAEYRRYDFCWRPDGTLLAILIDRTVFFWTPHSTVLLKREWYVGPWANAIAWLSNDDLAVAYGDANVRVYSWEANRYDEGVLIAKAVLEKHQTSLASLSVGVNGQLMVSADADKHLHVWDAQLRHLGSIEIPPSDHISRFPLKLALNPRLPVLAYARAGAVYRTPIEIACAQAVLVSAAAASKVQLSDTLARVLDAAEFLQPPTIPSDDILLTWSVDQASSEPGALVARTLHLRRAAAATAELGAVIANAARSLWSTPTRKEALLLEDLELICPSHGTSRRDATRTGLQRLLLGLAGDADSRTRTLAISAYVALCHLSGETLAQMTSEPLYADAINSLDDEELRRALKSMRTAELSQTARALAERLDAVLSATKGAFSRLAVQAPAPQTLPHQGLALIMKGGGMKGIAYIGALRELARFYSFDTYVGTSAGAITAALLGAGYTIPEMEDILSKKQFSDFLPERFGRITNLIFYGGLYRGHELSIWVDRLLATKLRSPTQVKFRQLIHRVKLYACRRDTDALVFDSLKDSDTGVAYAVRCSVAIPFFFTPERQQGLHVFDGGMRHNYPVAHLLRDEPNKRFIGLYLGPEIYEPVKPSIWRDLLNISFEATDTEALEKHRADTVVIDPDPISTLDFDLAEEEKQFLMAQGRAAALKFLHAKKYVQEPEIAAALKQAGAAKCLALERRRRRATTTWRRRLAVGGLILALCIAWTWWR